MNGNFLGLFLCDFLFRLKGVEPNEFLIILRQRKEMEGRRDVICNLISKWQLLEQSNFCDKENLVFVRNFVSVSDNGRGALQCNLAKPQVNLECLLASS